MKLDGKAFVLTYQANSSKLNTFYYSSLDDVPIFFIRETFKNKYHFPFHVDKKVNKVESETHTKLIFPTKEIQHDFELALSEEKADVALNILTIEMPPEVLLQQPFTIIVEMLQGYLNTHPPLRSIELKEAETSFSYCTRQICPKTYS